MPNHKIDIIYDTSNPQATWAPRPNGSNQIAVNKGDTISFHFEGPDTVADAVLLTGPRKKNANRSPFGGGTQINIDPDAEYKIGKADGLWGFAITFTTVSTDGTVNFYFLPDPELEVGSTGT